jgi:hypothetical protein
MVFRACSLSIVPVAINFSKASYNGFSKASYNGNRFPLEIMQHAIRLYLRVTLSLREVEELLVERGITFSYEIMQRWVNHFGPKSVRICAGVDRGCIRSGIWTRPISRLTAACSFYGMSWMPRTEVLDVLVQTSGLYAAAT